MLVLKVPIEILGREHTLYKIFMHMFPHPRVLVKVGVGLLRAVSGKARGEFRELVIPNGHVMSWYHADGLPALSGGVQGSCWPPRAHECTQGAAGNAGAKAWQGSRDGVPPGDVG